MGTKRQRTTCRSRWQTVIAVCVLCSACILCAACGRIGYPAEEEPLQDSGLGFTADADAAMVVEDSGTVVMLTVCEIDGQVLPNGTVNPDNPCQWCDINVDAQGWSPVEDGTACSDGITCTTEQCVGGTCDATIAAEVCLIDNSCVDAMSVNLNDGTQYCSPTEDSTGWTDTTCSDGLLNLDETATDCGGSCNGCGLNKACVVHTDCTSGACLSNKCAPLNPRPADSPGATSPGLLYEHYVASFDDLPDYDSLTPDSTGTAATPDLTEVQELGPNFSSFALRFSGYVEVPTDGIYEFTTVSDDGSELYIGNSRIVDNGGQHAAQARSGEIALAAGKHAITVTFFEWGGGARVLDVSWKRPGQLDPELIPASAFSR